MIVLDSIIRSAINPALSLLPIKMDSDRARVMLLTTTLQEADAIHRVQFGDGPAHGLWMFERAGAVAGVMSHVQTHVYAMEFARALKVNFDSMEIWQRLRRDDILAAGFARLLLWTHPKPLPDLDCEHEEAWGYYEWLWRPGKPRREKWDACHAQARAQVLT